MKRWLKRLLGSVVAAVAILGLLAWLTLRGSLPTLDGQIDATELSASATIERDADGIATITAATRNDLAFATGFAHGQDRFFQMDLIRRRSAGELAELFGSGAAGLDRQNRFHRFRSRAEAALQNLSDTEVAILEHYARGVNAGLNSLSARPFEYYLLRSEPRDWQAQDSILVVYTMFLMLNDSRATKDVQRGLAHRVLPNEVYTWLYPQGSQWDAPLMGEPRESAIVPSADLMSLRDVADDAPPAQEVGKPALNGSNNWAVGGSLTSTGRAIVSNDMHLGLSAPNIYYQARLKVEGTQPRDLIGVTLPGTPFVVAGSNTRVAWGYTNSYGDWTDAVVVKPGTEPGTYATSSGDRPFTEYKERINIKDAASEEIVIRETHWGPINESVDYPDGEIAVSWIAHDVAAVNLRLIELENASTVFEALDIANTMGMPPQNFMTGDAAGNIAWTVTGKIPVRAGYDPMLPAEWSDTVGWTGWVQPADTPRIINPPSDRLWSANARVADAEALQIIGDGGYDLGARAGQIRDGLFAKELFEPADMLSIQIDDRAVFLTRWRELLLEVLDDDAVASDESLREYRQLVQEWIPRATPQSVGYRLVRAFRLEVQARVFHALMASVRAEYVDDVRLRISNQFEAPLWSLVSERPKHLLPANYDSWQELMLAAVRENVRYLESNYDGSLAKRSWGERNTARIRHPMSRALPLLADYLDMPAEPLAGDVDMPRAQGPTFGASERFSVAPGDEANGLMQMPTGQSGHPLSPFYRRGHEDWVNGRPSPFLPGPAQHTLILSP